MSSGSDPTRCAAAPLDHPNRGRAPRSSKPAWPNIWRLSILIRAGPERLARVEQGHVWCVRLWVTDGAGRRPLRSARPRPAAVRRWRIAPPPTPCRSEPTTARSPRPRPRGRRPVRHRVRLGAPAGEMRQLARCLQLGAVVDGGRHAGTGVHRLGAQADADEDVGWAVSVAAPVGGQIAQDHVAGGASSRPAPGSELRPAGHRAGLTPCSTRAGRP